MATPEHARRPSHVAADAMCVAFAAWTVLCHAVVATGGNTHALALGAALLTCVGVVAALWWWRHGTPTDAAAQQNAAGADERDPAHLYALGAAALSVAAYAGGGYALWHGTALVLFTALLVKELRGGAAPPTGTRATGANGGHPDERILWLLALACSSLAVIVHRWDFDDAFYVGVAVATADFPDRALLSFDPVHLLPGHPLQSAAYRLHSFELLGGLLSHVSGIDAVWFLHVAFAACAGAMVPLCLSRLVEQLMPRRALWAVAATIALLLLDGDVHRSYGNFTFVRLFQGKAIFYAAVLPLIVAHAIAFARAPSRGRFGLLACGQIAAIGLTSSALPLSPLAAVGGLLTGLPTRRAPRSLTTLMLGVAASGYVVVAGAVLYLALKGGAGSGDAVAHVTSGLSHSARSLGASSGAADAMVKVLGEGIHLNGYLALALAAPLLLDTGPARRFCLTLSLCYLLLAGNPWLGDVLSQHVFGAETRWRALWTWPLPIMAGMVVASLASPRPGARRPWLRPLAVALSLTAYAIAGPGRSTLSADNHTTFGMPAPNLGEYGQVARALAYAVPAGHRVAAPDVVAANLPMFHDAARPIFVKRSYLKLPRAQVDLRQRLANCTAGRAAGLCRGPWLGRALDALEVDALCLYATGRGASLRTALREAGFTRTRELAPFEIWVRHGVTGVTGVTGGTDSPR